MFILHNDDEQTYQEALRAMSADEARWFKLQDIAKRHWTEELLCSALRNGCGELSEVPLEKRSLAVCRAAMEGKRRYSCANVDRGIPTQKK